MKVCTKVCNWVRSERGREKLGERRVELKEGRKGARKTVIIRVTVNEK